MLSIHLSPSYQYRIAESSSQVTRVDLKGIRHGEAPGFLQLIQMPLLYMEEPFFPYELLWGCLFKERSDKYTLCNKVFV